MERFLDDCKDLLILGFVVLKSFLIEIKQYIQFACPFFNSFKYTFKYISITKNDVSSA